MAFSILSEDVLDALKLTFNTLAALSQSAVTAPACFAAFSIFPLHMPQLPATLILVVVCACKAKLEIKINPANNIKFFITFF